MDNVTPQEVEATETTQEAAPVENQEVLEIPFEFILGKFYEESKTLGQLIFADEISEKAKSISVVRLLSNKQKQFFKITVEETDEVTLKK